MTSLRLRHGVPLAILAIGAGAAGLVLGRGQLLLPLGFSALLAATWFAYRAPLAAGMAVLLLLGGVQLFRMTPGFNPDVSLLGGGVRLEDVLMVGMLLATLLRASKPGGRRIFGRLLVPAVCLGVWLTIAVLRNAQAYGLSALGEFRFRYLVLAVPLCLMAGIGSRGHARRALQSFAFIAVALPILASPAVLVMKGFAFELGDRMFPSDVSLGLLVGLVLVWQCRAILRWPRPVLWFVTVYGALEILVDAHRSVWLAAIVIGLVMLVLERDSRRVLGLAFGGVLAVVSGSIVAGSLGFDVLSILSERGGAVIGLQDTTAARLYMWKANLSQFVQSPVAGRGLGPYWDTYVPELGLTLTVFPHNLYVMILVQLGAVGLGLFVWLAVEVWGQLRDSAHALAGGEAAWADVPRVGMAVLAGLAAYCVAYSYDPYTLTLLGICLAVAARPLPSSMAAASTR